MRIVAVALLVVVLLVGVGLGYCYYGAQMVIEGVTATLTPAVDALGTYNDIQAKIANNTFYGKIFRSADFIMPDGYAFLTLTVRMANHGLLPEDWIRLEIVSDLSDIAQLPETVTPSLKAGTRADFSTTLLTHAGVDTARTVIVTYYVMGRPFTAEYKMQ